VVAALTAQHTRGVTAVHVPPVAFLRAQIDACFADFRIGAVKIGMLANAEVIHAVADALEFHAMPPLVLDPVMVATSGAKLLEDDALDALLVRLVPMATVVTPNIPEAELLLGTPIPDDAAAEHALSKLLAEGARAVLLKGGHLPASPRMVDRFGEGQVRAEFTNPRLAIEGHGTGCTLSSAIAANLCLQLALREACEDAVDYVHGALMHAYRPGDSRVAVLQHFWRLRGDITP
jgi:hydroxymethylpyrimidine/phosphomethylpyrimidine kinase